MVWGQRGATYDSFFGRVRWNLAHSIKIINANIDQCVYDAMESVSLNSLFLPMNNTNSADFVVQ